MKLIMENWKNFLEEDCQDGYERVPGSKEFAQGSCRKKTNEAEDTRDTYGSEVEDRNRRSRKRGAAKLVGEEKKTKEEKEKEEYKAHMMYDPETGDSEMTKTYERHKELGKKGWGHDKPKIKEGEKEGVKKESLSIQLDKDFLLSMIREELEAYLDEEKKKACKPSKGKRFAKRVDGKCRSYGQAGQAKGGGDRIRPGTAKADAYCARSAKIKKCKEPPCANDLSRKKWKCRGDKSVA